eukprot:jgi/Botrbrau1/1720/Bobra.116_2s0062.1
MGDTKDPLPSSQQVSDGSNAQVQAVSESKQSINSSEGPRGQAVDELHSATESLETWDHIEHVDEVISASDSEGREAYASLGSGAVHDSSRLFNMPAKATPAQASTNNKDTAVRVSTKEPKTSKTDQLQPKISSEGIGKGAKTPAGASSSKRASLRKEKQVGQPSPTETADDQQLGNPAQEPARIQSNSSKPGVSKPGLTETLAEGEQSGRQDPLQIEAADTQSSSQQPGTWKGDGRESEGDSGHQETPIEANKLEEAARSSCPDSVPDQQQAAWGWKSWAKLTEQLKEAASGAARDVQELTTSFQQVLKDGFDEESDGPEEGQDKGVDSAEGTKSASHAESPGSESKRKAVLHKLEGDDTPLETGLKALDESMEQLSSGLKSTLGSLWGGARGVITSGINPIAKMAEKVEEAAVLAAKELVETVEEGVSDVRQLSVIKAAASAAVSTRKLGGLLAAKAETSLEQLGRQAIIFLEGTAEGMSPTGRMGSADELSFDHCFYVYGGRQSFEELEALGNECARLCNRLRSKLAPEGKAQLDAALASLGPFFDLQGADPKGEDDSEAGSDEQETGPVGRGHGMLADLCSTGVSKAGELAEQSAKAGAEELAAAEAQTKEVEEKLEDMVEVSLPDNTAAVRLEQLKREGVRRLSELASLCIERLLALGRSVSASFRHGGAADDGICWPDSPEQKASMLRYQARRMLSELEALTQAFLQALTKVGSAVQCQTSVDAPETVDHVSAMRKELEEDLSSAVGRVGEAFRGLLYVVLLAAQDRELLQAA